MTPKPPSSNQPATNSLELPDLTERQEYILSLIVREYIRDPQPVASKTLVDLFDLGVSSATVRNEMVLLEQHGLIYAPHTSAGRVPTPEGYRYFVHRLVQHVDLLPQERYQIMYEFRQAPPDIEEWMHIASIVLARTAQTAALVTPPRAIERHFKHLELINTQGRLVLMVLVLHGGSVHQQILTLAESVAQEALSRVAQIINLACAGQNAAAVRSKTRSHADALVREVGELVSEAMGERDPDSIRRIYRYGLSESLPAFTDDEARQAIRVLEERSLLDGIVRETLAAGQPDVHVVVGGEGRWEDLTHLSMVMSRYGTPLAHGALGVLGSTRMRYGRAISTVRYVASLMSDMLDQVYGEPENDD
ncbi:MAG: heat-inducible transcription repressor HrcA [Anaerolineae bacterium]|nr:heat-inducible transcription repressor HrcA [Anaerolineae bacterium]